MKLIFLAAASFFLLSWLLPNHYLPWLATYQDVCAFFSVLLLSCALLKKESVCIPINTIFFLLLMCIPLLQYFLGVIYFSGEAVLNTIYVLGFTTAYVVGFNIAQLEKNEKNKIINGFLFIFLFAGIISVWVQLRQWLLFNGNIWTVDMAPNGRPFANMGQPNQLATLLILSLMSLLYFFEMNKFSRTLASFTGVYLLFGLVLTQSRTAWIFACCLLVWWAIKHKIPTRLSVTYLALWCVGFFSIWFLLPYLSAFIGITTTRSLMERATTGLDRVSMWYQITIILQDAPILGFGWGQLNVAQLFNTSEVIYNPILGYSHNFFLDLLIWNGVILGSIFSCFIIYFLLRLSLAAKDKEALLLLAMIGSILLHSLFEYPFAYAYFLLPLGFILGVVYSKNNNIKAKEINRFFITVYLFFMSVVMFIFIYDYKNIGHEYELMRYENVQLRRVDVESNVPKTLFLNQLSEYIWFVRQPLQSNNSDYELERMRKVAYRYPDRPVLYRYMQILCLNNRESEAMHVLKLFNAFYKESLTLNTIQHSIQPTLN